MRCSSGTEPIAEKKQNQLAMVENGALIQRRERVVGRGETGVREQVGKIIGDLGKGKGEKELFGFEVGQLEHEIEL